SGWAALRNEAFPPFHTVDDDLTPPEHPLARRRQDAEHERPPSARAPARDELPPPRKDPTLNPSAHSDHPGSPTPSTRPPPPGTAPSSPKPLASSSQLPLYQSFDRLKSKSLLPERAGRYSAMPARAPAAAAAPPPSPPPPPSPVRQQPQAARPRSLPPRHS